MGVSKWWHFLSIITEGLLVVVGPKSDVPSVFFLSRHKLSNLEISSFFWKLAGLSQCSHKNRYTSVSVVKFKQSERNK